jgi:hypothetical protein
MSTLSPCSPRDTPVSTTPIVSFALLGLSFFETPAPFVASKNLATLGVCPSGFDESLIVKKKSVSLSGHVYEGL